MLKVLMIGGTGIISSDVTLLAAQKKNIDLYLLNRGSTPSFIPKNVKIIQADISNSEFVREKIKGLQFDIVADFISYDVNSLNKKLDIFRGRIGQYVFISSVAAYAKSSHPVITESNTPIGNILWSYGRNKACCERRLQEEYEQSGMHYTIVRPAYTYNNIRILHPYTINHWVSWTIAHRMLQGKPMVLHDDGQALCTATHTTDFAKAFVGLWGNPAAMNEDFHITSSEYLTWKHVAELTAAALGVKTDFCFVPAHDLCFELLGYSDEWFGACEKIMHTVDNAVYDNSKIKQAVPEFICSLPFAEGIKRTIKFYLDNPQYQKIDKEWNAKFDQITEKFHGNI